MSDEQVKLVNETIVEEDVQAEAQAPPPTPAPQATDEEEDEGDYLGDEPLPPTPPPDEELNPNTKAKVRDGIMIRWYQEANHMLRRPRTSTADANNRDSAKINKARMAVVMRKQKVTSLIAAIGNAAKGGPPEKTAAEISFDAAHNEEANPVKNTKHQVMRQYNLWYNINVDKMDLPPLPVERTTPNSARARTARAPATGADVRVPSAAKSLDPSRAARYHQYTCGNEAVEKLVSDSSKPSSSRPSSSVQTFCNTPRPQTAASQYSRQQFQTAQKASPSHVTRPTSCFARLSSTKYEFRDQEATQSQPVYIKPSPPHRSKTKIYRSAWLSPLEMHNVSAEAKLKYINDSGKKRYHDVMSYTSRLLKNRHAPLHCTSKHEKMMMSYKPDLGDKETMNKVEFEDSTKEDSKDNFTQLTNLLDESRDDPLLQHLLNDITNSVDKKRKKCTDHVTMNLDNGIKSTNVNPLMLGSLTSKSMLAAFYLNMKNRQ